MINEYYSLPLLNNICKNNCHKILTSYQESQCFDSSKCGFQIKVLGRVESRPNTTNLLFWSSKEDEL
jgi:hypothetical protein